MAKKEVLQGFPVGGLVKVKDTENAKRLHAAQPNYYPAVGTEGRVFQKSGPPLNKYAVEWPASSGAFNNRFYPFSEADLESVEATEDGETDA